MYGWIITLNTITLMVNVIAWMTPTGLSFHRVAEGGTGLELITGDPASTNQCGDKEYGDNGEQEPRRDSSSVGDRATVKGYARKTHTFPHKAEWPTNKRCTHKC